MRKSIHSPPYLLLRQRLVSARLHSNLTQEQLAARLGRPQSYVAKYEIGDRRLDVVELLEVCRNLNLDARQLLSDVQESLGD